MASNHNSEVTPSVVMPPPPPGVFPQYEETAISGAPMKRRFKNLSLEIPKQEPHLLPEQHQNHYRHGNQAHTHRQPPLRSPGYFHPPQTPNTSNTLNTPSSAYSRTLNYPARLPKSRPFEAIVAEHGYLISILGSLRGQITRRLASSASIDDSVPATPTTSAARRWRRKKQTAVHFHREAERLAEQERLVWGRLAEVYAEMEAARRELATSGGIPGMEHILMPRIVPGLGMGGMVGFPGIFGVAAPMSAPLLAPQPWGSPPSSPALTEAGATGTETAQGRGQAETVVPRMIPDVVSEPEEASQDTSTVRCVYPVGGSKPEVTNTLTAYAGDSAPDDDTELPQSRRRWSLP